MKNLIRDKKYPMLGSKYFQYQPSSTFKQSVLSYPSDKYLDWWLDRSDFYNENMKNY